MQKSKNECERCKWGMFIVIGLLAFITLSILFYGFYRNNLSKAKQTFCNLPSALGRVESFSDCGDYVILDAGCCDIPQTIVDKKGKVLAGCGGIAGWSAECRQKYNSESCKTYSCN